MLAMIGGIITPPRLLANLSSGARGELSPLCAFFGGIVGQEAVKAATTKSLLMLLAKDIAHDAELALRGYTVMRLSYAQIVHDWPAVERSIRRALAARLHLAS